MHTKFKYQKGLSFSFRGDDDVWAFINGKLAMDLGGTHYYMDGFINLDTVAGLVDGETYTFDLYYAERHSTGSHIRITSNVISASPSEVHVSVFPSDTIAAGDTALIVGTVTDKNGKAMPVQSDSIRWSLDPTNGKPGDRIIIPRNDSTKFTATVAYRRVGIIGSYTSGAASIIDTAWIYIKPGKATLVDIDQQSLTVRSRATVVAGVDSFSVRPKQTITLTIGQNSAYAYAVLRDRFGNYCALADSSVWTSQNSAAATVTYTANSAFEGVVHRPTGVLNGTGTIIVSQGVLLPDTAQVVLVADTLLSLRLVDVRTPSVALDTTLLLDIDSTITVKVQGIWSTAPGVWVDVTGSWSLNPAEGVGFVTPVPAELAGTWKIDPFTPGTTRLTVNSLNALVSMNIVIKCITRLRLVNIAVPGVPVNVIRMATDSSLTLKLQGVWSTDTNIWVDLDGIWVLNPAGAVVFATALPAGLAGQWKVEPSTTGTVRLTVTSHGQSVSIPLDIIITDRTGPHVQKAVLITGPLGELYDTLRITFSEPVRCDSLKKSGASPDASFKVNGPGTTPKPGVFEGARYLDGGVCSSRFINEVVVLTRVKVGGIVPEKDSIILWGSAVDTAGNYPDTSRRGPVLYGPGSGIRVTPIVNNDASSPMTVPAGIIARFDLDGTVAEGKALIIQSRGSLKADTLPGGKVSYGKTVIYDAVGNMVAAGLTIHPSQSNDRLYCVIWDGTNRMHRRVASGVYLLRVTVRYSSNPSKTVSAQTKFSISWQ
jgi:fibro-slime domain-containing protein